MLKIAKCYALIAIEENQKIRVLGGLKMTLVSTKQIIDHNANVMADNIFHGLSSGYSGREINEYESSARRNIRLLKNHLNNGGAVEFDQTTQTYIPKY